MKKVLFGTRTPMFSPKGFLTRAAALVVLFAVCHLAGLKEYTSVLCGMPATAGTSKETAAFLGIAYVMTYFMVIIGVPMLVIGAGIFKAALSLLSPKTEEPDGSREFERGESCAN